MDQNNELMHYGVLGMKWGVRRYQNYDGTLTEAGKKHISKTFAKSANKANKLDAKRVKYSTKGSKLQYQATKKLASATNEAKLSKALEANKKAAKTLKKATSIEKKETKWVKAMEKNFGAVKTSDISDEALEKGKKYVYTLMRG